MNQKSALYEKFKRVEEQGLKSEAKVAVEQFIASFRTNKEKSHWIWSNISTLSENNHGRIRHEIFERLVFPCLLEGYKANDGASIYWLGVTVQNLYQASHLHKQLDWITEFQLFELAHKAEPENEQYKHAYIQSIVKWLEHCFHEWPHGVLYGNDGANQEQLKEIWSSIEQLEFLDNRKVFKKNFEDWKRILNSELNDSI